MLRRVVSRVRFRRLGVVRLRGRGMSGSLFAKLLTLRMRRGSPAFIVRLPRTLLVLWLPRRTILFGVRSILVKPELKVKRDVP